VKFVCVAITLSLSACASVPRDVIGSEGRVEVRVPAINRYVIGGRHLYAETALYVLYHLRSDLGAKQIEFLVDSPVLKKQVRSDEPLGFVGCAQVELDAKLLAHDAQFSDAAIFEYDPERGRKVSETGCSRVVMTLEMGPDVL
jgi:hypothetical protein